MSLKVILQVEQFKPVPSIVMVSPICTTDGVTAVNFLTGFISEPFSFEQLEKRNMLIRIRKFPAEFTPTFGLGLTEVAGTHLESADCVTVFLLHSLTI
jgi:hypothetical protein